MFYIRLFFAFLFGLSMALLWVPLNLLTFWSKTRFSRSVGWVSRVVLLSLGIRVEADGVEHLELGRPIVIIINHQSGLDVFTFGSIAPKMCTVIGKKEIRYLPIIGWWLWSAGLLFIDRKNKLKAHSTIDLAAHAMKANGATIAIAPEGTRNRSGRGLLPFKKGAFHLAIAAQAPIVLAVSAPLENVFNFNKRLLRSTALKIQISEPISTEGLKETDVDALAEKVREKMLGILKNLEKH